MTATTIKVAIIEADAGLRKGLREMVAADRACSCIHAGATWKDNLHRISQLAPDVVIIDASLPEGDGLEGIAQLRRVLPAAQILIFSACEESGHIFESLRAGASGYLLKRTSPDELRQAIHEIKRGGVPMPDEVARKVLQVLRQGTAQTELIENLTAREQEILELLAEGRLSREIAQQLFISIDTVNSHLKHIYHKLQVRSRTEAVIKYLKKGPLPAVCSLVLFFVLAF